MASNGALADFSVANTLAAMDTMRLGDAEKKKVAMDYLSKFQKSASLPPPVPAHPRPRC